MYPVQCQEHVLNTVVVLVPLLLLKRICTSDSETYNM